ncbi:hypothetical protein NLI96_g4518 [Meripilus lineatus]|uniref:Uncharacterized protein n=1 Tax=Meripilus lineatus TaxID=2056292 RepID=A0AAD5YJU7_9APHY|nr:hypothetical protein NLI96_g4518 [Physisporinus lineatus]
MLFLYASVHDIPLPATPSQHAHPFASRSVCPCCRSSEVDSLPQLLYTPPTLYGVIPWSDTSPPYTPTPRTKPKVHIRLGKRHEPKQRRKVVVMKIRRLDDVRRVVPSWMTSAGIRPVEYTLISLEEARKREDIVYQSISGPRPFPPPYRC